MIKAPDEYTFSTKYLLGLPKQISRLIIWRGVMAERSSINDIVAMAREVEEGLKIQQSYDQRCLALASSSQSGYHSTGDASDDVNSVTGSKRSSGDRSDCDSNPESMEPPDADCDSQMNEGEQHETFCEADDQLHEGRECS
jgi:hypothetical protein